MYEAVLDHSGLLMQPHDLFAFRLVAGDAVAAIGDQLLDQLGTGSLVLDQQLGRMEQALLLAHRALERRVFEPPAEHTEKKEVFVSHTPGCAHRVIAELGAPWRLDADRR